MLKKIIAGTALVCCSAFANASFIEQTATVSTTTTDFSETASFNQFDDLGGSLLLQSVTISMTGSINGFMKAESLDSTATVITSVLNAMLSVDGLMSNLLSDSFTVVNTFNASAYDGSTDFGGTSGVTYENLGGTLADSAIFTDAGILSSFTGSGMLDFIFSTDVTTDSTGSGNISTHNEMNGGGTIVVTYDFLEAQVVNAPTMFVMLISGLGGLLLIRKKA